ncbi:MAG TPA: metallophosphatase [Chitinophagaceae bacterium]|nr:metallophosphatase [Chitinophagaceae bacterium]
MQYHRRDFIRDITAGTAFLFSSPLQSLAAETEAPCKLNILHTNDVHSRLDPFPMDGGKYQGMGGVLAREQLIKKIRNEEEHVLLLDAGDIFQGTPYFNFFNGVPEMKVMAMLGYDATTLGNHDFDHGMEVLATRIQEVPFPFLNCNYSFTGTPLESVVQPYTILRKGPLKIGILGVGIELKGLVPDALCSGVEYHDPVQAANNIAWYLKKRRHCDYIICLSHLGFEYNTEKLSDKGFAADSEYIDLIIGGHTHTFLEQPYKTKNRKNQEVMINQVGWAGLMLGRINIFFDNKEGHDYVSDFSLLEVKETRT